MSNVVFNDTCRIFRFRILILTISVFFEVVASLFRPLLFYGRGFFCYIREMRKIFGLIVIFLMFITLDSFATVEVTITKSDSIAVSGFSDVIYVAPFNKKGNKINSEEIVGRRKIELSIKHS